MLLLHAHVRVAQPSGAECGSLETAEHSSFSFHSDHSHLRRPAASESDQSVSCNCADQATAGDSPNSGRHASTVMHNKNLCGTFKPHLALLRLHVLHSCMRMEQRARCRLCREAARRGREKRRVGISKATRLVARSSVVGLAAVVGGRSWGQRCLRHSYLRGRRRMEEGSAITKIWAGLLRSSPADHRLPRPLSLLLA